MTELPANFRGDRRLAHVNHHEQPGSTWRFAMAGLCASLVGLGLARFAYTPLIPALIAAKWFSASDVVYLGAANLAGYLAGALLARPIAARRVRHGRCAAMMVLATLSCFACSVPVSFIWFFGWRFLAGAHRRHHHGARRLSSAAAYLTGQARHRRRRDLSRASALASPHRARWCRCCCNKGCAELVWPRRVVRSAHFDQLDELADGRSAARNRLLPAHHANPQRSITRPPGRCCSNMASTRARWCRIWCSSSTSWRAALARAYRRDRTIGCSTALARSSDRC